MKKIVVWLTSLSMILSDLALAAPQAKLTYRSIVKDVIKRSGVSSKPVRLKDLYESSKHTLPLEFRYEMERFLEVHPNFTLPKADVRMVKRGKTEAVQVSFSKGKQTFNLALAYQGKDVGLLDYSVNGRTMRRTLRPIDLRDPVQFAASVVGRGVLSPTAGKFTRLMRTAEIKQLSPEKQKNYFRQTQKTLFAMERVQRAFAKEQKKSSFHNIWLQKAFAEDADWFKKNGLLEGKDCVKYGWIGKMDAIGECDPPAEAKTTAGCPAICNPDVYGTKSGGLICGQMGTKLGGWLTTSGADYCGKEGNTPVLSKVEEAKADEDFNRISLHLNKLSELCARSMNSKVQKDECEKLKEQIAKMREDNCKLWKDIKKVSEGTYCPDAEPKTVASIPAAQDGSTGVATTQGPVTTVTAPAADPAAVTATGKTDSFDERADAGAPPPQRVRETNVCQNLPRNVEELDCCSGQVMSEDCGGTPAYYCQCVDRNDGVHRDTIYPVACEEGRRRGTYERTPRPIREEDSGGWFSNNWPQLLVLGATLFGGWLMIKANQSAQMAQIDQYYSVYQPMTPNPVAPPVVAPVTAPTTPGGVPFPTLPGSTTPPPGGTYQPGPGSGVLRNGNRSPAKPRGR